MKNLRKRSDFTSTNEEIRDNSNDVKKIISSNVSDDNEKEVTKMFTQNERQKTNKLRDIANKDLKERHKHNKRDITYEKFFKEIFNNAFTAIFAATVMILYIDLVFLLIKSSIEILPYVIALSGPIWVILFLLFLYQMSKPRK